MPNDKMITGCAGEHYVAYKLAAKNCLVALTRGGSPSIDLMVGSSDGQKTVSVQVKTSTKAYRKGSKKNDPYWCWRVSSKGQDLHGNSFFYAFVDLRIDSGESTQSVPDVFIVPPDYVRDHLEQYPKDTSKQPTDFWFILLEKDKAEWHERWDLIEKCLGSSRT